MRRLEQMQKSHKAWSLFIILCFCCCVVGMQAGAKPKHAARPPAAVLDAAGPRSPTPAPTEVPSPPPEGPTFVAEEPTVTEEPTCWVEEPTCLPENEMTDLDKLMPVDDKAEPEPVPAVPHVASDSKDDPMVQVKDVLKSVSKGDVPIYDDDNPPSTSSEEGPAPTPGSARGLLKLAKQEASFLSFLFFQEGDSLICSCDVLF